MPRSTKKVPYYCLLCCQVIVFKEAFAIYLWHLWQCRAERRRRDEKKMFQRSIAFFNDGSASDRNDDDRTGKCTGGDTAGKIY